MLQNISRLEFQKNTTLFAFVIGFPFHVGWQEKKKSQHVAER